MSFFSYHLVRVSLIQRIRLSFLLFSNYPGLIHAERMNVMTLGSPIFSWKRIMIRQVAFFAQWNSEQDLDLFLINSNLGKILGNGWYVRLKFVRQWGTISKFKIPNNEVNVDVEDGCVVAVTLARMKFLQIPRFIKWGRPAEMLVRDHQGTTLSLASMSLPNVVSTFSIWKSQKEMTDMVHGHSKMPQPKRHSDAMKERNRKDFHFEFTTLRFKPISEHGTWRNKQSYTLIKY
jgi:hypothetical protein